MNNHYLLSHYTILFVTREKEHLCYNSRSNCFLSISEGLYNLLNTNKQEIDIALLEKSTPKKYGNGIRNYRLIVSS